MSELLAQRRYWAIRTDKDNSKKLFQELVKGRLRQGWGYDESQDLRIIQKEKSRGAEWWSKLNDTQKEAWPHYRMLGEGEDSIKRGDIILLPNLPQYSLFCIATVVDNYYFEILKVSPEEDINKIGGDYGHVLPISLMTPEGINKYAGSVDASIRSTLRTASRMWNVNSHKGSIDKLISSIKNGADLVTPIRGIERLDNAWEKSLQQARETLHKSLKEQLNQNFQAAEWEKPIARILKNLYPSPIEVKWTGGPKEGGADIIITIPNMFQKDFPWIIVIQIKHYSEDIGPRVLEQIEAAYIKYSQSGKVLVGIILTTAERESPDFRVKREECEHKLGIPIKVILSDKLMEILTEGLLAEKPI